MFVVLWGAVLLLKIVIKRLNRAIGGKAVSKYLASLSKQLYGYTPGTWEVHGLNYECNGNTANKNVWTCFRCIGGTDF